MIKAHLARLPERKGYPLFKLLSITFIVLFSEACRYEQIPQKFSIRVDSSLGTDIADLFLSVEYLPLSKSPNPFHSIDQLRISADWIYLLISQAGEGQSEVMIFGRDDGHYFRSIKGGFSGPYDIRFISCIDIYKNRLYVMDPLQSRIFVYDEQGVRLTGLSVPDEYRKFAVLNEHVLILDSDEAPTASGTRLLYFNTQNGKSMPLRHNGKVQSGMAWERFFRKSNSDLLFYTAHDPNVYQIKESGSDTLYRFDFGTRLILESDIPPNINTKLTMLNDLMDEGRRFTTMFSFMDFNSTLFFTYYLNNHMRFVRVAIRDSGYRTDQFEFKRNTLDGGPLPDLPPLGYTDFGEMVFVYDAEYVYHLCQDKSGNKRKSPDLIALCNKIKIEDKPVLAFYRMK